MTFICCFTSSTSISFLQFRFVFCSKGPFFFQIFISSYDDIYLPMTTSSIQKYYRQCIHEGIMPYLATQVPCLPISARWRPRSNSSLSSASLIPLPLLFTGGGDVAVGEDVSGEGSVGSVDFSPASPSTWQKLDLLLAFSLTTVTSRRGGAAGGGGGGGGG